MALAVSRTLPTPRNVDGTSDTESARGSGYGEQYVLSPIPHRHLIADEGVYYVGRTPTAGTGVAGHAAPTSMDNTKPYVIFKNNAQTNGARVYLDYVKLTVTAAGTAGTLNYATHLIDSGAGYTSGGSAITIVQPNGGAASRSVTSEGYVGAAVATASASSQRIVSHQRVRTVIPVVGDVIMFRFGGSGVLGSAQATAGTAELERHIHVPPMILDPGDWYKLVLWRASQSAAASYEMEMGWWER